MFHLTFEEIILLETLVPYAQADSSHNVSSQSFPGLSSVQYSNASSHQIMRKTNILAHRGCWNSRSDRNSLKSILRALEDGFGLETDVRDMNGRLVISHDPPLATSELIDLKSLLDAMAGFSCDIRIALNIKSDGLDEMLCDLISQCPQYSRQVFVFDMSVPDSIAYLKTSIPVYGRVSEYESLPSPDTKLDGIWIDNFTGSFPQLEMAEEIMAKGLRAAVVSSELHHREHQSLWKALLETGIYQNPLFELCTDLPYDAEDLFCDS